MNINQFIQISDCHLDTNLAMGINTSVALTKTICHINRYQGANTLIATGDLAHQPRLQNYQLLRQKLAQLRPKNITIIAGNHDDKELLLENFSTHIKPHITLDNWQIIFVDSVVKGKIYGYLSPQKLAQLSQQLAKAQALHIFIALHHPVVSMQSLWDDNLSLQNPDDLLAVLDKFSNVRGITWGHCHEYKTFSYRRLKLYSCPSAVKQFTQNNKAGAYLVFDLLENGEIKHQLFTV